MTEKQEAKEWWKSKTLWVNLIALAALLIQSQVGYALSPEEQVIILTCVNIILRIVTKEPLEWKITEVN